MGRIAILHSTIRKEEKLLIESARKRKVELKIVDIRKEILDPLSFEADFDLALERSVSTVKGDYAILFLESLGITVLNSSKISRVCNDKFLTSLHLLKGGIPILKFAMVFDLEKAKELIDTWGGFPVVIKPTLGSWGRLIAKVNDRESLEAIFEHKEFLGSPPHKALYIQEYVEKPGRDIRAFIVGNEPICAVYRESEHWITNTARGGKTRNCPLTKELIEICKRITEILGEGLLAVDIFETKDGLKVNEVNSTMEFRNSEGPTGISISDAILDYCLEILKKKGV